MAVDTKDGISRKIICCAKVNPNQSQSWIDSRDLAIGEFKFLFFIFVDFCSQSRNVFVESHDPVIPHVNFIGQRGVVSLLLLSCCVQACQRCLLLATNVSFCCLMLPIGFRLLLKSDITRFLSLFNLLHRSRNASVEAGTKFGQLTINVRDQRVFRLNRGQQVSRESPPSLRICVIRREVEHVLVVVGLVLLSLCNNVAHSSIGIAHKIFIFRVPLFFTPFALSNPSHQQIGKCTVGIALFLHITQFFVLLDDLVTIFNGTSGGEVNHDT